MSAHLRVRGTVIAVVALLIVALGSPVVAATAPAKPTNLKATSTTSTATMTWSAPKGAKTYGVCLYTSGTAGTCFRWLGGLTKNYLHLTGLKPTGGTDYFFTVAAYNGKVYSKTGRVGFNLSTVIVPAKPVGLKAIAARTSTVLVWSAAKDATKYGLCLKKAGADKTCYRWFGNLTQTSLTVTGLAPTDGQDYFFFVSSYHGSVTATSVQVGFDLATTTPATTAFDAAVLTFNLCGEDKCVTKTNGIMPWSTRKPFAGAIVRSTATPSDIIATQESQSTKTNFGTQLPGFALGCYRSAKSLFYRTAKYSLIRSGEITLDAKNNRYACWVELQDKATYTRFIVTDVHLEPYKGKTKDDLRRAQTQVLLAAVAKANPEGLPTVYAGDFNSNESNANQKNYVGGYDAPLEVMTAAGFLDSLVVADNIWNDDYNSANQGVVVPKRSGYQIDNIFVDPSIHVFDSGVVISLAADGVNYFTPFASDHNPVQSTMTIPGNGLG